MPAWIWDPQFKYFADHFHVVALDPRSQGDSDKPTDGNSCERRAQDIRELLEHLKLDRVVLVGWSLDRKSTRLNSSHGYISYAVFCLKKKKKKNNNIKILE